MKKKKINRYAVYNKDGELIDILELNKRQYKEYITNNPEYSVQDLLNDNDILEMLDLESCDNEFLEDVGIDHWELYGYNN